MNGTNFEKNEMGLLVLNIPEVNRRLICWTEDSPNASSWEIVYTLWQSDDGAMVVFYLLDETADGKKGFMGPFRGIYDGRLFAHRIPEQEPLTRIIENWAGHKQRIAALNLLLGGI
jgi:hypothetical protein